MICHRHARDGQDFRDNLCLYCDQPRREHFDFLRIPDAEWLRARRAMKLERLLFEREIRPINFR